MHLHRPSTHQLVEVRSDVEGALLGWLPPGPTTFGNRHCRYLVDPYRLGELEGRGIVPREWVRHLLDPPWFAAVPISAVVLELPLEEWIVRRSDDGLIVESRTVLACGLQSYNALRAVRAFVPCP